MVAFFVSNTNPRERFVRLKLFMLIRVQKEVFVIIKEKGTNVDTNLSKVRIS